MCPTLGFILSKKGQDNCICIYEDHRIKMMLTCSFSSLRRCVCSFVRHAQSQNLIRTENINLSCKQCSLVLGNPYVAIFWILSSWMLLHVRTRMHKKELPESFLVQLLSLLTANN